MARRLFIDYVGLRRRSVLCKFSSLRSNSYVECLEATYNNCESEIELPAMTKRKATVDSKAEELEMDESSSAEGDSDEVKSPLFQLIRFV